jgi:hypothetical protein
VSGGSGAVSRPPRVQQRHVQRRMAFFEPAPLRDRRMGAAVKSALPHSRPHPSPTPQCHAVAPEARAACRASPACSIAPAAPFVALLCPAPCRAVCPFLPALDSPRRSPSLLVFNDLRSSIPSPPTWVPIPKLRARGRSSPTQPWRRPETDGPSYIPGTSIMGRRRALHCSPLLRFVSTFSCCLLLLCLLRMNAIGCRAAARVLVCVHRGRAARAHRPARPMLALTTCAILCNAHLLLKQAPYHLPSADESIRACTCRCLRNARRSRPASGARMPPSHSQLRRGVRPCQRSAARPVTRLG